MSDPVGRVEQAAPDPSPRAPERPARGDAWEDGLALGLRYYGFLAGGWLATRVPHPVGRAAANVGGLIAYVCNRRKRPVVRRNLARVVGEGPHLDRVVRAAFRSYARYWYDLFRLGGMGGEEFDAIETVGAEHLHAAFARGRGVVAVTAHFGSYDVAVGWFARQGYTFNVAVEVLKPRALFDWFAAQREAWGTNVTPSEPGAVARRRLTRALQRGEGVALPAERDLARRGVWVDFFGERTTFPGGPAALALHTGAALLWGAMFFTPKGYRLEFGEIPFEPTGDSRRDIETATRAIARALEDIVRRAPEQWHLFMPNWPSDEPELPPRVGRPETPLDAGS